MIKEFPEYITLRVSTEARAKLKALAEAEELSVSDIVRELIDNRLAEQ